MECLSTDTIQAYAAEALAPNELIQAKAHLAHCGECAQRVRANLYLRDHFDEVWDAWTPKAHATAAWREWLEERGCPRFVAARLAPKLAEGSLQGIAVAADAGKRFVQAAETKIARVSGEIQYALFGPPLVPALRSFGRLPGFGGGHLQHLGAEEMDGAFLASSAPDLSLAVCEGREGYGLLVWDLATGACRGELLGHRGVVRCVSVTPDGTRAVSGDGQGTLLVWDVATTAEIRRIESESLGAFLCVAVTPNGDRGVSGGQDGFVRFWDLDRQGLQRESRGHEGPALSVDVAPDGSRALSGGADRFLRAWSLGTDGCTWSRRNASQVTAVRLSGDGRLAVSGSGDGSLGLWDAASGESVRPLPGHEDAVLSVSVTPSGDRALSGSADRTIRLWDLETGSCLATLEGHAGAVTSVSVSSDGRRAVSASADRTLRIWELDSGRCTRVMSQKPELTLTNKKGFQVDVDAEERRIIVRGAKSQAPGALVALIPKGEGDMRWAKLNPDDATGELSATFDKVEGEYDLLIEPEAGSGPEE